MKPLVHITLFLMAVVSAHLLPAQNRPSNLGNFDDALLHCGIQVGYTQSKFDLRYSEDDELRETILGTTSYYSPGFHINVIGDLRLNDCFNLRVLPGVTITNRDLSFNWSDEYTSTHWKYDTRRTVESVYGEIPVEVKFRANRYQNFRPYLTAGGVWGFDVASLFKNKNNGDESIIRLNPVDISYTAGVGLDFFLRYVKFALELKMAFGLTDLLIPDNDLYTSSAEYLKSRTLWLSFTFEGRP